MQQCQMNCKSIVLKERYAEKSLVSRDSIRDDKTGEEAGGGRAKWLRRGSGNI